MPRTPSNDAIWAMSGVSQASAIRTKSLTSVEVVESVLHRIEHLNPTLNAFCTIAPDAIDQATAADRILRDGGTVGRFHGVPISVKDLVLTKGLKTTFGSVLYADFIPDQDDIVVERLRQQGAIVVGKTNVAEFGYDAVTDNALFGPTRNPWNAGMTAGGSSGGAAAAVASGMGALAVGSDGGGSLRVPASFCGICAIKPTFGRVPSYPGCRVPGLPGASSWESLECLGPITRTVEDAASMLTIMAGGDLRDRHSVPGQAGDFLKNLNTGISGLRVAWSPTLGFAHVNAEVLEITARAALVFESELGCQLDVVHPPINDPSESFLATVANDTDLRQLRRLCGGRAADFSAPLMKLLSRDWTAEEFTNARVERQRLTNQMYDFMVSYDLLLTPTVATAAFPVEQSAPDQLENLRNPSVADWSPFTPLFNMTGQPAATVPAGWTSLGLPVGLQIVGRLHHDHTVVSAAAAFEAVRPWHSEWPSETVSPVP